jgi:N-acetylmuramic acid 6-phosphate etherase
MKGKSQLDLSQLATEQANPAARELDTKSALEIARIINAEDTKVAAAVQRALSHIAIAIDWAALALRNGGRMIYVGAGTSGRIAALDAAECPPTFNTSPRMVQFVIAGGTKALAGAVEADEDSRQLGVKEMRRKRPGKNDVVVGLAASGRTPFTVAALEYARQAGAKTVAITCNARSPLEKAAELAIVVATGPEVVAGSTRMKAGTAEKMVLNILSTGAMVRLGYVYGNLMVNLHRKNSKLAERSVSIVQQALEVKERETVAVLKRAKNSVPVAIVMSKADVKREVAVQVLTRAGGHVRNAITLAKQMQHEQTSSKFAGEFLQRSGAAVGPQPRSGARIKPRA